MDKPMNYKTCLHILLFTIFFTMSFAAEKSNRNIALKVKRKKKGDIIRILDGDVKCNDIQGTENNVEKTYYWPVNGHVCKCSTKTPIFNVFLNHTYGCYYYKTFCKHQGCIARFGSYKKQSKLLTIDVNDVTRFLSDAGLIMAGVQCVIQQFIRNISLWNNSRWESISTNKIVNMKWPNGKPVEEMKTQSDKELSGKLILFKMWCPKQQNPKVNHVMITLAGKETFTLPQQLFEKTTMAPSKYNTSMTPSNDDTATVVPIVVVVVFCIIVMLLVLVVFRKKKKKKKKKKNAAKTENMAGSHPSSGIDENKSFSNEMYAEANSTYCEIDETKILKKQQHRPQHEIYDAQCTEPSYSMTESKYYEINQHQYSSLDIAKQHPEHYEALNLKPPVCALKYEDSHNVDNAAHEEPIYFETEGTYYEAGTVLGKNEHHSDHATEKVKISVLDEIVDKSWKNNARVLVVEGEYPVGENPKKSREMHNNIAGSLNNHDVENEDSYEYNYAYEKHCNNNKNVGKAGVRNDGKLCEILKVDDKTANHKHSSSSSSSSSSSLSKGYSNDNDE